jgi:hypothetical protein
MSFCEEIRRAVMASPRMKLPEIRQIMYQALGADQITEAEAEELDTLINAKAAVSAPGKPVQRRCGSMPRSSASMARRRSWAAAGRLPPALATRFTISEQAVLAVVAVEVKKHGACTLTVGHIAALAGVSETTVRNAIRAATVQCLLTVKESRRSAWYSNPNTVCIVSKEWAAWLRLSTGANSYTPRVQNSKSTVAPRHDSIDAWSLYRPRQSPAEPDQGIRQSRGG